MTELRFDRIQAHRDQTFRLAPGTRLRAKEEAVAYVNERGFVYFWPIKELVFPSLWSAVAGDRRVADKHDDPGHVAWSWKDELLGAGVWYYAKLLRKKSTFISLETLPHFYALSENYGEPETDYLEQYREGRLSHEERTIYEVLLNEGPLDSPALRRSARMTSRESDAAFNRAMGNLQADFKLLPIGVAEVGSWKYAFIYDLTHRRFPDLLEQARAIPTKTARTHLVELFLRSVGAAPEGDVAKLFGWAHADIERAIGALAAEGRLRTGLTVEERKGNWIALPELVGSPAA